jgi:hypothetical protein
MSIGDGETRLCLSLLLLLLLLLTPPLRTQRDMAASATVIEGVLSIMSNNDDLKGWRWLAWSNWISKIAMKLV